MAATKSTDTDAVEITPDASAGEPIGNDAIVNQTDAQGAPTGEQPEGDTESAADGANQGPVESPAPTSEAESAPEPVKADDVTTDAAGLPHLSKEQVDAENASAVLSQARTPLVDQTPEMPEETQTGPTQEPVTRISPPAADPAALAATDPSEVTGTTADGMRDHQAFLDSQNASAHVTMGGKVISDHPTEEPQEPTPVPDHDDMDDADYSAVERGLRRARESQGAVTVMDMFGRQWFAQAQTVDNQSVIFVRISRGDTAYETYISTASFDLQPVDEDAEDPMRGMIKAVSDQVK